MRKIRKYLIVCSVLSIVLSIAFVKASTSSFNNITIYSLCGWDMGEIPNGTVTVSQDHAEIQLTQLSVNAIDIQVVASGQQWGPLRTISYDSKLPWRYIPYQGSPNAGLLARARYRNSSLSFNTGTMSGYLKY